MNKNTLIRSISAFVLLLLFAFSITPRRLLHDCFANHKDTAFATIHTNGEQLTVKGFNCDCNSLVATSPYTDDIRAVYLLPPSVHHSSSTTHLPPFIYLQAVIQQELRGPPCIG